MGWLLRPNRIPVVIIFNECTINGTGDLSVEQEVELEGSREVIPLTIMNGIAGIMRRVMAGTFIAMGAASKEDIEKLKGKIAGLEETLG